MKGVKMMLDGDLSKEMLVPPNLNGKLRQFIIVNSIIIYDTIKMTEDDLKICGCEINSQTSFDENGKTDSEVILNNWFYAQ